MSRPMSATLSLQPTADVDAVADLVAFTIRKLGQDVHARGQKAIWDTLEAESHTDVDDARTLSGESHAVEYHTLTFTVRTIDPKEIA